MLADNGMTVNFSLLVTNSGVTFEFGVAGLPGLTLAMEVDNFFDAIDSEEGPIPTSISLGYSSVELVINNFEPTGVGEDMGDVLYNGTRVGDLVVEEDGLYIVFNNGNKKNIADLMPNSMAMMEGIPI
jgi:hypothetical protein